jgi:hypothetical protein
MRARLLLAAFAFFCLSSVVHGQGAVLSGCVLNDVDEPEAGLVVIVGKLHDKTNADGKFTIEHLLEAPGSPITVSIKKEGWAVLTPFMGHTQAQNSQTNGDDACIPMTVVKRGSRRFLEAQSLTDLIGAMKNAALAFDPKTETKSETEAARDLEKEKVLEAYEMWSGVEVKDIRAALSERGEETNVLGIDKEAQKAYLAKKFSLSGQLWRASGTSDTWSEKRKKADLESRREQFNELMNSGTSYFEGYDFKEALVSFEIIENKYFETGEFSKETLKSEWLDLKYFIGRTKVQLSSEAKLDEATTLLGEAINSYKQALGQVIGGQFLGNRAKLQYGLGTALLALGQYRFNLNDGIPSINKAIVAFDEAAQSVEQLNRTGKSELELPSLQISIGEAWNTLGEKTTGRESVGYFNKALKAYGEAAKVINSKEDKRAWGDLNLKIGGAFLILATKTPDTARKVEHLKNAVERLQEASTTYTALLDSTPNSCVSCAARSLMDLAFAWSVLGVATEDPVKRAGYRDQSLDAFDKADAAINRIKREQEPFMWVELKLSLGSAFANLAARTGDPTKDAEYLGRGATAYGEAYALAVQGYCPPCAVSSSLELGNVWSRMGQDVRDPVKGTEDFGKAAEAFDTADQVINRSKQDGRPLTWAGMKFEVGRAFANLAIRMSDSVKNKEYLGRAAAANEEAYVLANQDYCSACAVPQLLTLGNAWDELAHVVPDPAKSAEYRTKMLEAFDRADRNIDSIKRGEEPIIWAGSKARLGLAFSNLAHGTSDPATSAQYFNKAATAFEAASTVYNSPDVTQDYCAPCAVHSLIDLGDAWNNLGLTVRSPAKSAEYANKALDAYNRADGVIDSIKRNENKFLWADLKTDLGQVFSDVAGRTSDPAKKAEYLNKAVRASEEVAKVYEGTDAAQDYCTPCAASTLIALGQAWDTLGRTLRDQSAGYRVKTLEAFDKADKAINGIKRGEKPFVGGSLKASLGDSFAELSERERDPAKNAEYLDKAAAAYEEESKVYATLLTNEDYCSPCLTSALIRLGTAWNMLGERAADPAKRGRYFDKALDVFGQANRTVKPNQYNLPWAELNFNLGRALVNLAYENSDPARRADFINKAAAAFDEVSKAYTTLFAGQDYRSPYAAHSLIKLGNAWDVLGRTANDPVKDPEYLGKTLEAFDRADKAINRIKGKTEPLDWAGLKGDLGDAYSDLANGVTDPAKNAQYLAKAATAYEEEAGVYAELLTHSDYCSPCASSALIGLGTAWNMLGERAADPAQSVGYLNRALDTFGKADNVVSHDENKLALGHLNLHLGHTLSNLADRTSDPAKRTNYLNRAVSAYEEAGKIYTLQHNPQEWAEAREQLAVTYLSLENWAAALELSDSVLQAFPDDDRAYSTKSGALHDGLFRFPEAFEFNKKWVDGHPDDFPAKLNFAEKQFTTGRFAEAVRFIDTLLIDDNIYAEDKTALQAIQIGCLLAAGQPEEVSAKLGVLIDEVEKQPSSFRVRWVYRGVRHFVGEHKNLAAHREWLEKLFDAIENNDRDTMIKRLKDVRAKFKT